MAPQHAPSGGDGSFLTIILTLFAAVGFFVLLILLSGGIFLFVLVPILGIAAVALFHYALWGRSFSQAVTGEREELAEREQAEVNGQPVSDPHKSRRL